MRSGARSPLFAVKLVELLQGKWLGHPLHPALVHLPIGGWLAAAVLDVIAALGFGPAWVPRLATYAVLFGLIGAVLAVPAGLADWTGIKKGKPAWKLALYHLALNAAATVFWTANALLRWRSPELVSPLIVITSLLGAALVFAGGYVGSLLTFDHGISVARESKQRWRKIAKAGGARLPDET